MDNKKLKIEKEINTLVQLILMNQMIIFERKSINDLYQIANNIYLVYNRVSID